MCEYVFEPEQCINVTPKRDDSWECPRDTINGSNKCEYHADVSELGDDTTEEEVFIRLIEDDIKIVGARFDKLELTASDINEISANSINIYNAEFNHFEMKSIEISKNMTFFGCEFGTYNEHNTTNRRVRRFIGCYCKKPFTFDPDINFEAIKVKRTTFSDSVQIEGEYRGRLMIEESVFNNVIRINNAELKSGCKILESVFRGEIHISDITVTDEMQIKSVELPLKSIISDSEIEIFKLNPKKGLPSLVDIRDGTELSAGSLLNTETAEIYYDLSYARIGDIHIDLDNGNWENYLFMHTHFTDFKFIDYEDKIRENNYKIHEFGYSEDLFYESRVFPDGIFHRTDKYLSSEDLEFGVYPSPMLFFASEPENKGRWFLPDFLLESIMDKLPFKIEDGRDDTWFPADLFIEDYEEVESVIPAKDYKTKTALRNQTETYTRAKNHAQSDGIGTLVSGFHVLLNRAERAKYASRSRSTNSIRGKVSNRIRSSQNWFLRWLYNYGEGTYYPLGWSALTIGLAAILYMNRGLIGGESTTTTILGESITHNTPKTWIEALQYSVFVFTSLGSSSITPQTLVGGTLVSLQSMLGAILIALFVFTLGRQASR